MNGMADELESESYNGNLEIVLGISIDGNIRTVKWLKTMFQLLELFLICC